MVVLTVLKILASVIAVLLSVAFFTLVERKMLGSIHRRRGPNVVGFHGLLQAFADGLKLFVKETVLPSSANKTLFVLAPIITFTLCLMGWNVIPFGEGLVIADLNIGILFILAISSLGVYGIIISGWSSNSKYAFLGGLRAAAQMVSYEVSIGFIIITVVLCAGSFNLSSIVLAQEKVWFVVPHFPMFVLFFISALAETARMPFDLTEAESELVSGYNVEYSAVGFVLFFLGEYGNILLMSALTSVLFLGGWLPPFNFFPFSWVPGPIWFALKIAFFVVLFILMRACLPRFRYDQLMALGWKVFLPFSLGWLLLTASILISFNWLPN
jgi:NADH-quinone oxidoreductase subunit H